jgi:zinc protease
MSEPFTGTTLANGLQVFLKEIHTAPLISAWIWYRVGSRDEVPGRTGLSHWVEHMQFKGTPQFPAAVLDRAISRDGGMWNAMTYLDWTAYYATMPAGKIDLVLRLEADRMTSCHYDPADVESERTVVISEREGSENEPLFVLGEAVQRAAFRVHPYRHEVIGEMADLKSISRDDLYVHYRSHYIPNNAVLAMAGDFESGEMLARIEELFGGIPAGAVPRRVAVPEPALDEEIVLSVAGPGETVYAQACYHFPAATHPDFYPLSVLDSLLAGPSNLNLFSSGLSNKTSRLYRALVEKELAVGVHGGAQATIDPFLYTITLTVHPQRRPEDALAALDAEIDRLCDELVTSDEVARAVKQARALFAYGSENITNQASWLGYAEMFADYNWFLTYLDRLALVTPADVRRVAQQYFGPRHRVVGTYLPQGGEEGGYDD